MAITRFTDDQNVIAKLDDRPNDTGGLSAAGLKAKFDESGLNVKDYINNTLLPFLESAAAAGNLGVDTISGLTADTVQEALQAIVEDMADITQGSVADGSITTAKLNDGAVTTGKLAAGAVAAGNIADGAVTAAKLDARAVTTAKIALLAVTTALLADGAVTTDKLAALAVTAAKIANAAVDNTKLAENAVTGVKIAAGAVTTEKLAAGAVTYGKIATGSVTTAKILDGSVTAAKLGSDIKPVNVGIMIGTDTPVASNPGAGEVLLPKGMIYLKYST